MLSAEVRKKLERAKELSAHRLKSNNWAELLELMADHLIKNLDPAEQKVRASTPTSAVANSEAYDDKSGPETKPSTSRYIPKALKKSVFAKAGGQCEFTDPRTGRRCDCRSYLQVDHIHPLALSGTTTLGNLRLLCSTHNQRAAAKIFGREKMQAHWRVQ